MPEVLGDGIHQLIGIVTVDTRPIGPADQRLGGDTARGDHVDQDLVLGQQQRQVLGDAGQRRFGRGVGRQYDALALRGMRREVDDARPLPPGAAAEGPNARSAPCPCTPSSKAWPPLLVGEIFEAADRPGPTALMSTLSSPFHRSPKLGEHLVDLIVRRGCRRPRRGRRGCRDPVRSSVDRASRSASVTGRRSRPGRRRLPGSARRPDPCRGHRRRRLRWRLSALNPWQMPGYPSLAAVRIKKPTIGITVAGGDGDTAA